MSKSVTRTVSVWGLSMGVWFASIAGAHEFTLLKGKGTEVCEAYVRRLSQTDFSWHSPLCGRPEDTSVPGFAKLDRVKLSYDELYVIGDLLLGFYSNNDQDYLQKFYAKELAICDQPGREKYCEGTLARMRSAESSGLRWRSQLDTSSMRYGSEFAWRYEPAIDIDNDSKPDPVLLFQRRCDSAQPGATYAYVMVDDSYRRIDGARTRAIFGHPHQQWLRDLRGHETFRYMGLQNGVFVYRDHTYFDTFFSSLGDFNDERRGDPTLPTTLGVFHHQDGRTQQVCEIRWTAPANFFVK